ncbi:MAG: (Fe-S)-binding protein [Thermoanaerobaculia bacterium]
MNKAALFIPCFINKIEPEIGIKAVEILEKLNLDFIIPEGQTCCGQPFFNSGFPEETIPFAKNFIKIFKDSKVDKIIFFSSSCYGFVKNHYEELNLKEKFIKDFKEIKENIVDFYEILEENIEKINFKEDKKKVYLHPSCHLLREAKVYPKVKNLLSKIKDIEILEEEIPFCCGFGGTFSIKEPEISVEMAKRKFKMVEEKNPDLMLIPDTSCWLQLKAYKEKNNVKVEIKNLIEYLYEKII